ncbi:MAG: SusC/RagA family TonB-linked outer membrane protein [Candidatus Pseudobacter hemicellulosilyticus]|uniref:SusC/RagA family TonB-linked outer membrane protein n=1 Tax=Candidatus Pseudobacter hemicellulosilyticus TaxID=3121375 RepID=A0AAJ6BFZ2_9BACT|nr:MAG: SusC/RagA family TonB-linked outer membrane protein [Pseudobacter sp.]
MRLSFLLILGAVLHCSAAGLAQNVTLTEKTITLEKAFREIRKQTGVNFLYTSEEIDKVGKVSVSIHNQPLSAALAILLRDQPFSFSLMDDVVVIRNKPVFLTLSSPLSDTIRYVYVSGLVYNTRKEPLEGATVTVRGTKNGSTTSSSGFFSLRVESSKEVTLEVSSIGYKQQLVKARPGGPTMRVELETETTNLDDVVVSNGMFNRRIGSFTGAVTTFNAEQLKAVSNQNVLKSLAILDPSFQIVENIDIGSDPNRLPEIQLRGQTGFPDLKGDYLTNPNLPLFILDGFETTLEKVNDLNLNLVKSITLLKDASAKAVYGSKAGNGVVVIETKPPIAGKLRVSYNGSLDIAAPDLSSYHLTNAVEKLEAEVLAGVYSSIIPGTQAELLRQYGKNMQAAQEGVNTYWLAQPLRNGAGQRHAISLEGGDALRYNVNFSYNNVAGVMKGSDRNTISGNINLTYRLRNFQFRNNLMIDKNRSENSPYGSFGTFASMNPYWKIVDSNGNYVKTYGQYNNIGNPVYDGSLNSKNFSEYTNIVENFYADWDPLRNLRFTARVGITIQNNSAENFIPASHSMYANVHPNSEAYLDRGEYSLSNGKSQAVNADLLGNYSFQTGRHHFFVNGAFSLTTNSTTSNGMTMVGFPNDKMNDISFGYRYKPGTKASGVENTSHTVAITSALNYSYDDRLLADLSYRGNASSQFGAENRWGLFWSAGLGWNVHREKWMKAIPAINQFRLRASTGTSGTQNFNSYQAISTYQYITNQSYNGDLGALLLALPNPYLQWQEVLDNNVGIDLLLWQLLSIRFDYYIKDTRNLLSDMIVAPSAGFATFKENIGESRNEGYQVSLSVRAYSDMKNRTSVNVFANLARNKNHIRKVSNSLEQLNRDQDNDKTDILTPADQVRKPSTRFQPGQSMTAIWVVPSLGIDPANGREIYQKRDGSLTYIWDPADQVVMGDATPEFNGSFGINVQHKGFSGNFAFNYRLGGQQYNTTLVSRVENADFNYNVDSRALEDRWKKPGDISSYKNIADRSVTRPTSRFVQDLDELLFSSVSLGYDLSELRLMKKARLNRVYLALNLNDIGRISTVKTERGLDYPFARTISTSLNITF